MLMVLNMAYIRFIEKHTFNDLWLYEQKHDYVITTT